MIVVRSGTTSLFSAEQRIDRYRLIRRLGAGAFAEVWLAVEDGSHGFRKEVALKLLKRDKADQETLAALLDEARVCGMLQHPHLVDVYGVGICDGTAYIAMEYVRGTTLMELLRKLSKQQLSLPLSVILDIAIEVSEGLDYAHTAEDHEGNPLALVHRDLKPSNLMLSKRSGVKIADFGLAKASTTSQSTEVGTLRGTPGYIAPEVWGGSRDFGPHTDLFAVGAILWEMAVGTPLFRGSLPEVIGSAMHGSPEEELQRLRLHQPQLASILQGLLQRDPKKRTPSAWKLLSELQQLRAKVPAPGGLSFFLSLVYGDLKVESEGGQSQLAAMGKTADPQWLGLLDSEGSLLVKLDRSQLERREQQQPEDPPLATRRMERPDPSSEDTLDLRGRHHEAAKADAKGASGGTLWRAEVKSSKGLKPRVAIAAILAAAGLGALLLWSGLRTAAVPLPTDTPPAQAPSSESLSEIEQRTSSAAGAEPQQAQQKLAEEAASDPAQEPPAAAPESAAEPSKVKQPSGSIQSAKPPKVKTRNRIPKNTIKPTKTPIAAPATARKLPRAAVGATAAPGKDSSAPKVKELSSVAARAEQVKPRKQLPSRGCLSFRSSPGGAKVFIGRKDSGRFASPRSKPLALPSGRVMVHMDGGQGQRLSQEAVVHAGKSTIVTCNFVTSSCSAQSSNAACP
tara:strand:- start:535 stop:2577 length:2043 start_codon:yes stop_codon:yes gene_type:complete